MALLLFELVKTGRGTFLDWESTQARAIARTKSLAEKFDVGLWGSIGPVSRSSEPLRMRILDLMAGDDIAWPMPRSMRQGMILFIEMLEFLLIVLEYGRMRFRVTSSRSLILPKAIKLNKPQNVKERKMK